MGKTRAEIQKAYRERQKQKGSKFLEKERARQNQHYVPASQLSAKKLNARNYRNKLRNRLSRSKKRDNERVLEETSGYGTGEDEDHPGPPEKMIIKIPFVTKRSTGIKKVKARALSKAHRKIQTLKSELSQLRKKIKSKNKKLERISKRARKFQIDTNVMTPNKKTALEISSLNLTPRRRQTVRRKILTGNVLMADIEKAKEASGKKKVHNIHRIVSGKIAKKYRVLNQISRCTYLSRRSLARIDSKQVVYTKERRRCLSRVVEDSVIAFLNREDNSRTQPGKNDAKKVPDETEKKQTKVLTDYLKNLHAKYEAENLNQSISLATFTRLRPTNILLACFISRNSCQLIHHQNMALKVQSVRKMGVRISENPEKIFIHTNDLEEILTELPETVHYRVWKKVEIEGGEMKMMIVDEETDKKKFTENLKVQIDLFHQHVERVREQYHQVRTLETVSRHDDTVEQMEVMTTETEQKKTDSESGHDVQASAVEASEEHASILYDIENGAYVAAVYEGQWYIGKVEEKDDEGECEINFLHRAKQMFKWPQPEVEKAFQTF